jgi:cytochrome P450
MAYSRWKASTLVLTQFNFSPNQLNTFLGDEWRHSRAWLSPQFAPGKINKTRVLIAKHAIQLRKDLDEYSEDMENLQKKWFHLEKPDPNARYTRSNFYNPKELKSTIDLFGTYAFSVVVDFSFAHGTLAAKFKTS